MSKFLKIQSYINLPCGHKNLGPIGSAILTFIGYKQTKYIFFNIEKITDMKEEWMKMLSCRFYTKTNLPIMIHIFPEN